MLMEILKEDVKFDDSVVLIVIFLLIIMGLMGCVGV